ncbi:MAG: hypothetical protein HYW79_03425 [Parcubacteria group bacterium]|nr:hypothetical protein [Parcubacteria group bacterium]
MNARPPRLTVDEYFDLIALIFACRGTCDRLRTATVIRDNDNILIAGGYNGAISGLPHCDDIGHLIVENHCIRTNHGEENALLNCIDLSRIENGVATIIGNPCFPCARKVLSKDIKRLRYIGTYDNSLGFEHVKELCEQKSVVIEFIDIRDVLETLQKAIYFLQGPGGPFRNMEKIMLKLEEKE